MNSSGWNALIALTLFAAGCGDDGGTTVDAGMDGSRDGGDGAALDCDGMPDGTACTEGFICLRGVCSPSECGDGYVDEGRSEACDDGNEIPGDGCEPSACIYTCADDAACDNGNTCDGAETCNEALHRCQAGAPIGGMVCTREGGGEGVCNGGLCADADCGDGVVNGDSEDCDDGNDANDDGCKADCTYTCVADTDCTDADECTGAEACAVSTHTCTDPADLDCDDSDTCTMDSCDAELGCVQTLIDGDGDTYAAGVCTTAGLMGGDCDDSNSTIYPGATELCDSLDNDCDMAIDNDTVSVTCMRDSDSDGYGNPSLTMELCSCPTGYIPPRADGETDCRDTLASVNPGVTAWFTTGFCPARGFCLPSARSYDYNCDGVDTRRWTRVNATGCSAFVDRCGSGWTGGTAPACGSSGSFQPCGWRINLSGLRVCVASTVRTQAQECQ